MIDKSRRLRETVRLLVRSLQLFEKSESNCCNVTLSQCHAVVELGRAEAMSLNELAGQLNLDNSTMSRTINNLVKEGLAERQIDSEDRRYVVIRLTNNGQQLFHMIENGMNLYFQSILNCISEDKQTQVIESLELLLEAIRESKCC